MFNKTSNQCLNKIAVFFELNLNSVLFQLSQKTDLKLTNKYKFRNFMSDFDLPVF